MDRPLRREEEGRNRNNSGKVYMVSDLTGVVKWVVKKEALDMICADVWDICHLTVI